MESAETSAYTWRFAAVAVLTGIGAGVGGIGFTFLLHLVQHVGYGFTHNSFEFDVERASGARRVIAMSAGGVILGTAWWALRRGGRQVATIGEALSGDEHRLPFLTTTLNSVLQIVGVGIGASLGREGAPREFGAAAGVWLAERAGLRPEQRRMILACGAGAGLAAVYNVPLGGAAFTLEVLLASLDFPVVVAAVAVSVIATATAWIGLPNRSTYAVGRFELTDAMVIWAIPAGLLIGILALVFIRLMAWARAHQPQGWRLPVWTTLIFAAVGALAVQYPQVLGNGKGAAQLTFDRTLSLSLPTLAVLTVLKPLVTAACLRSGALGGLLTPSIATGALFGALAGGLWNQVWPSSPTASFALIGAAAMLSATQRAPITAIVLVVEFTHTGLGLLVPVMLAVTGSVLVSHFGETAVGRLFGDSRPEEHNEDIGS